MLLKFGSKILEHVKRSIYIQVTYSGDFLFLFFFLVQKIDFYYRRTFFTISVPRDSDGNSYNRHINLQLTYSFQNTTHNSIHINNNNNNHISNNNNNTSNVSHNTTNGNNISKTSMYTAHGK